MKRITIIASVFALVLAFAGCAAPSAPSSSSASMPVSDVSASASSESSSAAPAIAWKSAKSAAEAAKGAGFETFGAFDKIEINDTTFKSPTFSYVEGLAQALYESGAMALDLRKADSKHASSLSDRDKAEFANTWTKTIDGTEVTCFGPARGAATLVTWAVDKSQFGATFQGLGGEEVTMDEEEVANIVKAVKKAETPTTEDKSDESEDKAKSDSDENYISVDAAKDAAIGYLSAGVPDSAEAELKIGGDAPHYDVTLVYDGDTQVIQVDAYTGDVWGTSESRTETPDNDDADDDADDGDDDDGILAEEEAIDIAEQTSGGEYTDSELVNTDEHGRCWRVTTEDENGNVNSYYVDNDGNAYNTDFD